MKKLNSFFMNQRYDSEGKYTKEYLESISFDELLNEVGEVDSSYKKAEELKHHEDMDIWLRRRMDLSLFLNSKYKLGLKNPIVQLSVNDGKLEMRYECCDDTNVEIIIDDKYANKIVREAHFDGQSRVVGDIISETSFPVSKGRRDKSSDILNVINDK